MRALLSESVVLALTGGALGVALAQAAIGLLRRIAPAELPRIDEIDRALPRLSPSSSASSGFAA